MTHGCMGSRARIQPVGGHQRIYGRPLLIEAEQGQVVIKPGETEPAVAESIIILGFFRNPITYPGIYGYNGYIFEYNHKTLFKGWQACS
jgi:hypothetical protein